MKEYIRLQQAKDEFDADGEGKPTLDNIVEQENGTMLVNIKDGDSEVPIEYTVDEDGQVIWDLPEGSDVDEDTLDRLTPKIVQTGKTAGKLYKEKMELNKKKADYEAQLAEKDAEIARLKRENEIARTGKHRMTDEDAKKCFGVETVAEVQDLMTDDYGAWMVGQAKFQAQFVTPVAEKTEDKPTNTARVFRATAPKSVDGAGGGGKSKEKTTARKVNEWLAGIK